MDQSNEAAEFASACDQMLQAFSIDVRQPAKYGYRGYDWFQLSSEEEFVFRLSLSDMPSLTTVQFYYDAMHGGTLPDSFSDNAMIESIRRGLNIEKGRIGASEFGEFAKLFGVSYRKSHAWYNKHDAWVTRQGITKFADE